ncbi:unnamed protein product, partial [Staurois parvus]
CISLLCVYCGNDQDIVENVGSRETDIVNAGRPDIVNAGSKETGYSECRVRGDQI